MTQVSANGAVSRGVVVTDGGPDSRQWEEMVRSAALDVPPPYHPQPGRAVYMVSITGPELLIDGPAVVVGEDNLVGPLRDLVEEVLAADSVPGRHEARATPNLPAGLLAVPHAQTAGAIKRSGADRPPAGTRRRRHAGRLTTRSAAA